MDKKQVSELVFLIKKRASRRNFKNLFRMLLLRPIYRKKGLTRRGSHRLKFAFSYPLEISEWISFHIQKMDQYKSRNWLFWSKNNEIEEIGWTSCLNRQIANVSRVQNHPGYWVHIYMWAAFIMIEQMLNIRNDEYISRNFPIFSWACLNEWGRNERGMREIALRVTYAIIL